MKSFFYKSALLLISILILSIMDFTANANEKLCIKLNEPHLEKGLPVMRAFKNRHSEREWADYTVSLEDMSDLLWAADGVNRSNGKRTAPSALGKNDIDIYVFTAEGAYLYVPQSHELRLVASGDNRQMIIGGQPNITQLPPLALVYVSIPSRFGISDPEAANNMGYIDGGMVSENVGLFCAGNGLVTVPRYTMDRKGITGLLSLPSEAILVLNDLIGYPANKKD